MRKKLSEQKINENYCNNLCFKCINFKLNKPDNCPIVEETIKLQQKYNIEIPVLSCETFQEKEQ